MTPTRRPRRRFATLLGVVAVAGAAAAGATQLDISGAHVAMSDGEIASRFDRASNETEVTLALRPEGPDGVALLMLVARHPGRVPITHPQDVRVYAYLHTVNPTRMRRSVLGFVLGEPDSGATARIDLTAQLRQPRTPAGELLDGVSTLTLVEFSRLLRAPRVTADLFGLDFPLDDAQRAALWVFAAEVLPDPPGDAR